MNSVKQILFIFLSLLMASTVLAEESNAPLFHSDQNKNQYVIYKSAEGDWPVAILRRLKLRPIFSENGSLRHFFNLNPDLERIYRSNKKYVLPEGSVVVLPITKLMVSDSEGKYEIQNGALRFLESPKKRQANDLAVVEKAKEKQKEESTKKGNTITRVLNLRSMVQSVQHHAVKKGRALASVKETPKKIITVQKRKATPAKARSTSRETTKKRWADFNYKIGSPIVRLPVEPGSPIFKLLQQKGFIALDVNHQKTIWVEVPLHETQPKVDSRDLAAIGVSKVSVDQPSNFQISAQTLTATRLYSIVDSAGQSGEIGVDPGFGAQLGFDVRYGWLNIESLVQFQTENFRPDSAIAIDQETQTRFDIRLRQKFEFDWVDLYGGLGVLATPSFVTTSATSLQAKHLNRTYIHLGFGKGFKVSDSVSTKARFNADYLLGVEDGLFKLDPGYRFSGGLANNWRLSNQFYLTGDVDLIFQDDNPTTYEQTHLGTQILFGLQWQFGNTE